MADQEKKNLMLAQAEREFATHYTWWEKEEPKAPLPARIQAMLNRNDPAVIDELLKFAFLLNGEVQVWDYNKGGWQKLSLPEEDMAQLDPQDGSWLWTLYVSGHPLARKAVRKLLSYQSDIYDLQRRFFKYQRHMISRKLQVKWHGGRRNALIPFDAVYFRYVKAIFKLAEKKGDAETWAILAHRFDLERKGNNRLQTAAGQEVEVYSDKTHYYLRRRCWRYLRELGKKGNPAYIRFAVEALLQYEDQDARYVSKYENGEWLVGKKYDHLWLFNHLLFHRSQTFKPKRLQWEDVFVPYDGLDRREEAFPDLWDQHADELWRLFNKASSGTVISFAWNALRHGNRDYLNRVPREKWMKLLDDEHNQRNRAALAWLLENEILADNGEADLALLEELLFHIDQTVREKAADWFGENAQKLPREFNLKITRRIIDIIKDGSDYWRATGCIDLLRSHCRPYVSEFATMALIKQLQDSGSRWSYMYRMKEDLLALLLEELDVEQQEVTGVELLPLLSSANNEVQHQTEVLFEKHFEKLKLDLDFLLALIKTPNSRVQAFTTRFLSDRLLWVVPFYPALLPRLWEVMLDENENALVRNYIRDVLLGKLFFEELRETPISQVLALLQHQEHAMQAFGAQLLALIEPKPHDFTLQQLVDLAHRPLAEVRAAARQMLEKLRLIWSPDLLVNVMETDWDDTREWAMCIVTALPTDEQTPELIYGLLDTARRDIRALAMELIDSHLTRLDLTELMMRASESPYLEVQEFALAIGDRLTWTAQRMTELELFFRTVFFRVHRGRRAKNMAFALLERLALEKQECAEAMVPLLNDMVRNFGRQDFERIVHLLTQIKMRYPHIQTPLTLE